jgi:hypothetical protein
MKGHARAKNGFAMIPAPGKSIKNPRFILILPTPAN